MSATPVDVTTATFDREVVARSREVLVIVDFWADWCGPCRTLGPSLERAVAATGGRAVLAKIDVDRHPELSQAFNVTGIPMVLAFRDGRVVAEFVGAQPAAFVDQWIARLLPSALEEALAAARRDAAEGRRAAAIAALEPHVAESDEVRLQVGRWLVQDGRVDAALAMLRAIRAGSPEADAAAQELLLLDMCAAGAGAPRELPAAPSSAERFAHAGLLWNVGDHRGAMLELLELVRRDRAFRDDGARRTLLAIFDHLGAHAPLVEELRGRLGAILFA